MEKGTNAPVTKKKGACDVIARDGYVGVFPVIADVVAGSGTTARETSDAAPRHQLGDRCGSDSRKVFRELGKGTDWGDARWSRM